MSDSARKVRVGIAGFDHVCAGLSALDEVLDGTVDTYQRPIDEYYGLV